MKSLSLKVQQIEESQTLAFTQRARQMKAAGIDVVSLTAGEPDFPTPLHIKMAAIQAIDEDFTHYTATQGIPELLSAIAKKFECDNQLDFGPSQILVSSGAKHAIFNALQAICNKGDEVVIPAPYWVSFPEMVKLVDAVPVIVPSTFESQFKITPRQLRQAINAKTKALIFNSPGNPTGTVYSQGEIEELGDIVRDTGIYVISDEIYEKVVYDGARHFSIGSIKQIKDQVITVNGLSKSYSMTGWRVGYLGGAQDVVDAATKVQGQTTTHATSIAQRAAVVALTGPTKDVESMVMEFRRRRDYVYSQISAIPGVEMHEPKGAFYLLPSLKAFVGKRYNGKLIKDDVDLCHFFLEEEHLAMVPGSPFGAKNFVRLSYAASMKELQKGVERMKRGCKKLSDAY